MSVTDRILKDFFLFLIITVMSLSGYFLLIDGVFSLIWLANAVVTGMLLRSYCVFSCRTLVVCYLGMVVPGLLYGIPLLQCLLIHLVNLISIIIGYSILHYFMFNDSERKWTKNSSNFFRLFLFMQVALLSGSFLGGAVFYLFLSRSFIEVALTWYCNELLNYTILLPLILVIPTSYKKVMEFGPLHVICVGLTILLMIISIHYVGQLFFLFLTVLFIPLFLCIALTGKLFLTTLMNSIYGMFFFLCLIDLFRTHKFNNPIVFFDFLHLSVTILAISGIAVSCVLSERNYFIAHDFLTGVLNRRAFNNILTQKCKKEITQCALMIIDIDHFKSINDNFGHQAGDQVLINLCKLFKTHLRHQAIIGRMGGEEFAILLAGMSRADYERIGQDLVTVVQNQMFRINDQLSLSVTISCGLAIASPGDTPESLYHQADLTMYQAKQTGRNRLMLSMAG